jgi:hypothetical protein
MATDELGIRRPLTPRQEQFAREWAKNPGNATEAARRAGYSAKSARTIASHLLDHPGVRSAIRDHFLDAESLVSSLLKASLLTLQKFLDPPKESEPVAPDMALKAAKVLLQYSKLAVTVLGLNVAQKLRPEEVEEEPMSLQQLKEALMRELAYIEKLEAAETQQQEERPQDLH